MGDKREQRHQSNGTKSDDQQDEPKVPQAGFPIK